MGRFVDVAGIFRHPSILSQIKKCFEYHPKERILVKNDSRKTEICGKEMDVVQISASTKIASILSAVFIFTGEIFSDDFFSRLLA